MIGGDQASRTRHIFHDKCWLPWDMLSHMPREQPRVGVKTAAGRKADNDANRFVLIEWFLRDCRQDKEKPEHETRKAHNPVEHQSLPWFVNSQNENSVKKQITGAQICAPRLNGGKSAPRKTAWNIGVTE